MISQLDWLDDQAPNLLSLVRRWSEINSGSHNLKGLAQMAEHLVDAFKQLPVTVETLTLAPYQTVSSEGEIVNTELGKALLFCCRSEADTQVLLTGHYDTVFPQDSHFQSTHVDEEGLLHGPGVADMKGGLAIMLHALMTLERSPFKQQIGYRILISPDEEIGSPGSAIQLQELAQKAQYGLTYEPALADGTLAGDRKGSGNFTIVARGLSAHAGRSFEEGRNAVSAIARLVVDLEGLNNQHPGLTLNIAKIEGGGANNVVPDLCLCRFNIRVVDAQQRAWVESQIRTLLQQHKKQQGISFSLHGSFNRPPKKLDSEHLELYRLLAECGATLGLDIEWQATGGCCEGNNLAAAGLPNIDTLGPRGANIHSDKEFAVVDSLVERAKLSALFLMRLAEKSASPFPLKKKEPSKV